MASKVDIPYYIEFFISYKVAKSTDFFRGRAGLFSKPHPSKKQPPKILVDRTAPNCLSFVEFS